jgi:hypothetical protein
MKLEPLMTYHADLKARMLPNAVEYRVFQVVNDS